MLPIINNEIEIKDALKREDLVFIDVRSPGEYALNKIPGALNVPLFNNEEREELGIVYKDAGSAVAQRKGLEFAVPKLTRLVDHIETISGEKIPALYCWRGGLRSSSLSYILQLAGMKVFYVKGGYKAYRRFINHSLQNYRLQPQPIILHGLTGTGKTLITKKLIQRGYAALDLERLACHRGSVFGQIGFHHRPSQKNFDGMLWQQLEKIQHFPYVVIEKEGNKMGPLFLPQFLVNAMEEGIHILLKSSPEVRARRIVEEYVGGKLTEREKEEFRQGIEQLTPRLGKKRSNELIKLLEENNYYEAALILCRDYYDRLYPDARPDRYDFSAQFNTDNLEEATDGIIDYIYQFIKNGELQKSNSSVPIKG